MTDMHWTTALDRLSAVISAPRFGLLSDFDGTLSYFKPYPEVAQLTPRNRELIVALTARLPLVALISGRAARELQSYVQLPDIAYIGNHGLEELRDDEVVVLEAARVWEERLNNFSRDLGEPTIPGVRHQNKRITMSITYRQAEQPEQVRLKLQERLQQVNANYGFQLSEGRTIWEVRPPIAADKGTALANLIAKHQLDAALFLGDDFTDVAAFESLKGLRSAGKIQGLNVAVLGATDIPLVRESADVIANNVEDVETLLAWVLEHLPTPTPDA